MTAAALHAPASPTFARHETFHLRYGWIHKGFTEAARNPNIFLEADVTVTLGVGKNMVSAIRFWSSAFKVHRVYPFNEAGITKDDVYAILENAGVGVPSYYEWPTRSGCTFCFFQRKVEWVGLAERHLELFEQAVAFEEKAGFEHRAMKGRQYTWSKGETLRELLERKDEIVAKHEAAMGRERANRRNIPLIEVLGDVLDDDDDTLPSRICNL